MVESLEQKLMSLEQSLRATQNFLINPQQQEQQQLLLDPRIDRGVQYEMPYPVSKRWYFPMLLHFSRYPPQLLD